MHKAALLLSIATLALIGLASLLVQKSIEAETVKEVEQSIQTVLDATHQAMDSWMKQHKAGALAWANTADTRSAVGELLDISESRESLIAAPAQDGLRALLRPVLQANAYQGYALIAPGGVTLAASREDDIGGKHRLSTQPKFLKSILAGGAAFSLPQANDDLLIDSHRETHRPSVTMFVGAPVRSDAGGVVAMLIFELDPSEDFTAILQQGRIGATGETYAFDSQGRLISESRFEEQLRGIGLLSADERAALKIDLRNPGVDLTRGEREQTPTLEPSLTFMAREAIAGISGTNMAGYRDYRGVVVVGAWLWDRDLGFGIATELDRAEAYRALDFSLKALSVLTIFCSVLVMGLTAVYVLARRQTVAAGKRLRQIVDLVPNMILVADQSGRVLLANRALAKACGTTVKTLQEADSENLRGQEGPIAALLADSDDPIGDGEAMLSSEECFLDQHGKQRMVERQRIAYQTDGGAERTLLTIATDITARKQMEATLRESEEFSRSVLRSLAAHIAVLDSQGKIRAVNDAWERFAQENGNPENRGTGVGVNYFDVCRRAVGQSADEAHLALGGIQSVIDGKAPGFTLEYTCHAPDQQRWFLLSASPLAGGQVGAVVSHVDITARKLAELELMGNRNKLEQLVEQRNRELYQSEQNLRSVVESALGVILWLSPEGQIVGFNPEAERLYGKRQEQVIGETYADTLVPETQRQAVSAVIDKALMGHPTRNFEYSIKDQDGCERTFTWNVDRILGPGDEPTGVIAVGLDITTIKKAEQRLEHLAHFDQLTGLPNRLLFHDRLHAALARARRHGKQVAVLYIDLDSFKQVNDTLGHQGGDRLLATTAERLKGCVREEDTVARLGGDEFALILDGLDHTELAHSLTKRALHALDTEITFNGKKLRVSASVGVAVYPANGDNEETILRHADHAMYYAKGSGKNAYRFFDPEMNARLVDRIRLESDLRGAIGTKQLFIQYQPKYNLSRGCVVGVEALVRWNHPKMGIIPPARFIPLAEETGLIIPLGRLVMEQACQAAREWQEDLALVLPIAVNLSARQFRHESLVEDLRRALDRTELPPNMLELELTESLLMEDIDTAVAVLNELKRMGVRIAMDDFGSGYSSLSYLKKLPVDVVKIDRSFVKDILVEDDDRAIVAAIISMAHSLDHKVIAEGVEKVGQIDFLKCKQCDEVQGYFISPPVFPTDMAGAIGRIEKLKLGRKPSPIFATRRKK